MKDYRVLERILAHYVMDLSRYCRRCEIAPTYYLPPYMCIYLVVNLENIKFYKPSPLDQEEEKELPSIEDLAQDAQEEVVQNYKTRVP